MIEDPGTTTRRGAIEASATRLLAGGMKGFDEAEGRFALGTGGSSHGVLVDELEAAGRLFMLSAFIESGRTGSLLELSQTVLNRVLDGVRASSKSQFPQSDESNGVVEAAGIAIALWISKDRIWDTLPHSDRAALAGWLRPAATATVSQNNWLMFPVVVSSFLDCVGEGDGTAARRRDQLFRTIREWSAGSGWFRDGERGAIDFYNSWAFRFYLPLLRYLLGTKSEEAWPLEDEDLFLQTLGSLFAPSGAHVLFGRSLTYRFAASAAFSVALLVDPERSHAATYLDIVARNVQYFSSEVDASRPAPIGWTSDQPGIGQSYSGPYSSYWMAKTFVILALPTSSPVWDSTPQENAAQVSQSPPGLMVQSSQGNPTVRIYNVGSDNLQTRSLRLPHDDPFYSRLGYSSYTAPTASAFFVDAGFGFQSSKGRSARVNRSLDLQSERSASLTSQFREANPFYLPGSLARRAARWLPIARSRLVPRGRLAEHVELGEEWAVVFARRIDGASGVRSLYFGGWALEDAFSSDVDLRKNTAQVIDREGIVSAVAVVLGDASVQIEVGSNLLGSRADFPVIRFGKDVELAAAAFYLGSEGAIARGQPAFDERSRTLVWPSGSVHHLGAASIFRGVEPR